MHPADFQAAVINVRDFEAAELKANHVQAVIYQLQQIQTPPQNLPQNRIQRLRLTQQSWRLSMVVHQPIPSSTAQPSGSRQRNSDTRNFQNPNAQHYLSLLVTPEDTSPNNPKTNQEKSPTNNIPPATITNDKLLAATFSFEFKEITPVSLFSKATLNTKPITTMYTDVKVDGHVIKLILDSGSAGSIITRQLMDQLSC
ncbi:hypothetical protein G9A89_004803 [Geosiphon pyriformis]|nr:hypothetical protein G9A89_004803 [Geosiphon pyriformis]